MSENDNDVATLQDDWKQICEAAKTSLGATATSVDIARFMKSNLMPFIGDMVSSLGDLDGCVEELMGGVEETLQPETGRLLSSVIVGGIALVAKLEELAPKDADGSLTDKTLGIAIGEYRSLALRAQAELEEIVLPDVADDYEDVEDEDDEDSEDDTAEGDDQ